MSGLATFGFAVDHDQRSVELYRFIADMDYRNGDGFCFKSGGDGDNGEFLMALLDEWFALQQKIDRDALMTLAEVLSTPELETDCVTCPLRKWCEEARDSGNRITCFECKLWHTADAIREACGEEAKDEA